MQSYKIDKPCSEDWNNMLPSENGRYCEVCAKEVMDLDDPGTPKPGDKAFSGCGMMREKRNSFSLVKLNFFQAKFIRWFGIAGLIFVPVKKAKSQELSHKFLKKLNKATRQVHSMKKIVGALEGMRSGLTGGKMLLMDGDNIIAQSRVNANGKFIFNVDTSAIKNDSVSIVSVNPGIKCVVDTVMLANYKQDSLFIRVSPWTEVIATAGVLPYYELPVLGNIVVVCGNFPVEVLPGEKLKPVEFAAKKDANTDLVIFPQTGTPEEKTPEPMNTYPEITGLLPEDEEEERKRSRNFKKRDFK